MPTDMDQPSTVPMQGGKLESGGSGGGAGPSEGEVEVVLKEAIRSQIEFYFSPAHLQKDNFLLSQMNAQMYVPVPVVAQLHKIASLTMDHRLIVESLKDSKLVTVGDDGIRPNIKVERTTIVLREIPSETPHEVLKSQLLSWDGCPPVQSLRSDVGDTWFVTMASEPDAQKTLTKFRDMTFDGKPIKARLKSENALKSLFISQPPPTTADNQGLKQSTLRPPGPPYPGSAGANPVSMRYGNGYPLPPNGGMAVPHYGASQVAMSGGRMYGGPTPPYPPRGSSYMGGGNRAPQHQHQSILPVGGRYVGPTGSIGGIIPPGSYRGSGGGGARHTTSQPPSGPPIHHQQHGGMYGGGGLVGGYTGRSPRGNAPTVPYRDPHQRFSKPTPIPKQGPEAGIGYHSHPNSGPLPTPPPPGSNTLFPPQQPAPGQPPSTTGTTGSKKKKKKDRQNHQQQQQQQQPLQPPQKQQPSPPPQHRPSQLSPEDMSQLAPVSPISPRPSPQHDPSILGVPLTPPASRSPRRSNANSGGDRHQGRKDKGPFSSGGGNISSKRSPGHGEDKEGGSSPSTGERSRVGGGAASTKTKGEANLTVQVSPPKINHDNFPPLSESPGAEPVREGQSGVSSTTSGVWSAGAAAIRGRGATENPLSITTPATNAEVNHVTKPNPSPKMTDTSSVSVPSSSPRHEASTDPRLPSPSAVSSTSAPATSSHTTRTIDTSSTSESTTNKESHKAASTAMTVTSPGKETGGHANTPKEPPVTPPPSRTAVVQEQSPPTDNTSTTPKRVFAGYAAALMNGPGVGAPPKAKQGSTPPIRSPVATVKGAVATGAKENSPHEGSRSPSSTQLEAGVPGNGVGTEASSSSRPVLSERAHRPSSNHPMEGKADHHQHQQPLHDHKSAGNGVGVDPSSPRPKMEDKTTKKPHQSSEIRNESEKKSGRSHRQDEDDEPIINFTATPDVDEPSTAASAASSNTSSILPPQSSHGVWGKRSFVDVVKRSGQH